MMPRKVKLGDSVFCSFGDQTVCAELIAARDRDEARVFKRGVVAGMRQAVLVVENALRAVERKLEEKAVLHPDMERIKHLVQGGFIRLSSDVARDRMTAVAALERAADAAEKEIEVVPL
jgi:hypothetical protein